MRIVNPVLIFAFISNKNFLLRLFIKLLLFFLRNIYLGTKANNFEIIRVWFFSLQILKRYDVINTGTTILEIGNNHKKLKSERLGKLHGQEN